MNTIFKNHKDNPPVFKNQPPVAGSINWEKSLFHHIKRTMLQFLPEKQLMSLEKAQQAKAKYLAVGRSMRAYSDNLHKEWYAKVDEMLITILRQPLLVQTLQQKKGLRVSILPDPHNPKG